MPPKHSYAIGICSGLIILALLFLLYTQYTFSQSLLLLNQKIDDTTLSLQQQMLDDSKALQDSFNTKVMVLEEAQIKSIDQIQAINKKIKNEELTRENELKELQDQIIDAQAKGIADLSSVAKKVLKSVVSVRTNTGSGSGVFISADGTFITNYHVINGATAAVAVTHDQKTHRVVLVGYDAITDLALLKIDSLDYDHLFFTDSDRIDIGEKVLAAGNPRGLEFSISEGIVSAKRKIDGINYIQTDVPINPGNSGGPLITTDAKIVGINTFKFAGSEGLGFAIAANTVTDVISSLQKAES